MSHPRSRIGVLRIGITSADGSAVAGESRGMSATDKTSRDRVPTAGTTADGRRSGRRAIRNVRRSPAVRVFGRTPARRAWTDRASSNGRRGRDLDGECSTSARAGRGRDGDRARAVPHDRCPRGGQERDADLTCVRDQPDRWPLGRRDRPEKRPSDLSKAEARTVVRIQRRSEAGARRAPVGARPCVEFLASSRTAAGHRCRWLGQRQTANAQRRSTSKT